MVNIMKHEIDLKNYSIRTDLVIEDKNEFNKNRCLVTKILSITSGPKESGVEFLFPNPIIRQVSSSFIFILDNNFFKFDVKTLVTSFLLY